MISTSRKPCVVMRPVGAPLRSSTALVAIVVACRTASTKPPATPTAASSFSNPWITASAGLRELVGTFSAWVAPSESSISTKSVKVPPTSKATRIIGRGSRLPRADCRAPSAGELPMRGIEGATHARQHLVDLAFGDDQRRREGDPIADHAQHQSMLVSQPVDDLTRTAGRSESASRRLILDEFDAGNHADAGH